MLLIAGFKKDLKDFVKKELQPFSKSVKELSESKFLIDSEITEVLANTFLLENLSVVVAEFKDVKEIKADFSKFIKSDESFKVKCAEKQICVELGQLIKDSTNCEVSLDNPDKTFNVEKFLDKYYSCLIIPGAADLIKRGYAANNNEFLTADVAKAMIDLSGYKDDGLLIDPFCHEGYTIIECALKLLNVGPAYFNSKNFDFKFIEPKVKPLKNKLICCSDSMADIKFSKQNAKTSKTFKFIDFGFSTLNDIDYTFKEAKFDYFVTALPKNADVEKLFFQLDYIMKKECVIVILTSQDIAGKFEEYGFKIKEEMPIINKKLFKMVR